ncbi:MAG: adenosylmethionine--8-amino-7-oxononanoate transaminase [Planctomycetes bacterium]|nr:adenosylmethionine--8-amino-7-oxononanoate transaminase [Planctomycetota bacterium]
MNARRSELVERDLAVLWHPCGQQRDYQDFPPLEVVAAKGCRLTLADGRQVLDAIASWWCKSLGHGHPRLRAALIAQAETFEHVILANTTNEPVVRLCERLLALANGFGEDAWGPGAPAGRRDGHFARVFFADNGSTGVEVALKLALQAQAQSGRPRRTRFAALANGYHGETVGALSVGDCGLYKDTFAPLLFPCAMIGGLPYRSGPEDPRWQDVAEEWPAIERALAPLADELAAIVYEPVLQGAGGMRLYAPALLSRLRAWADAHDVLLIADEIAAGMGRCGAMLASHLADDALADIAVLSKGLTGGFLPLAAVLTTQRLHDAFDAEWSAGKAFLHSNTYAGNALAVAVANAALDAYAEEAVLAQVAANGPALRRGLRALAETRPFLRDVRGVGMMAAVDLRQRDGSPLDRSQRTGWRVYREAVARGALLRPLGDTMYLFPPLNTGPGDLRAMIGILADSVDAVLG